MTCGQSGGDTVNYINMYSYWDWYDTVVDSILGVDCYESVVETELLVVTVFEVFLDIVITELVFEVDLLDQFELGLVSVSLCTVVFVGVDCVVVFEGVIFSAVFMGSDPGENFWCLE